MFKIIFLKQSDGSVLGPKQTLNQSIKNQKSIKSASSSACLTMYKASSSQRKVSRCYAMSRLNPQQLTARLSRLGTPVIFRPCSLARCSMQMKHRCTDMSCSWPAGLLTFIADTMLWNDRAGAEPAVEASASAGEASCACRCSASHSTSFSALTSTCGAQLHSQLPAASHDLWCVSQAACRATACQILHKA